MSNGPQLETLSMSSIDASLLTNRSDCLADFEFWLAHRGESLVEALKSCPSDERVRAVGLRLIELLRDAVFSRGARQWFQHDLEFFYAAEQRGVHILPVHFYSPVPRTTDIEPSHWNSYTTPGVNWRANEQWGLLEDHLQGFVPEFLREAREGRLKQVLRYAPFVEGDLALYYAMIRDSRPKRILEIGAGVSTHVAFEACRRNAAGQITCVEPHPTAELDALGNRVEVDRVKVQKLGPDYFQQLAAGDILFIDSTHVVAIGSDVNHLVLQVLPTLRPGVLVHFHDMHLPREMPQEWIKRDALFWTEQYLVQAFLAFNSDFEVVLSSSYLGHVDSARYHRAAGSWAGGSLWIQRIEGEPAASTKEVVK